MLSLAAAEAIDEGAGNGEAFRHGTDWSIPGAHSCIIAGRDWLLRMTVPAGGGTLAIDVRTEEGAVGYAIRGGKDLFVGGLAPRERSWLVLAVEGGPQEIAINATGSLVFEDFMLD